MLVPPVTQQLLPWLVLQVLRKRHGPRQFVYYSKSSGQTSAARKSSQQEQWPLKGPGPSETSLLASKAPQTSPMPTAQPGQSTQTCVQPPRPAPQQQQFAMPPPAPPCPARPWLSGLTQQQVANSRSQGTQSAQLHLQHEDGSAPGPAKAPAALPPVPPPLPPLPWVQKSHGAATKEQQAWRQQQQQQQSLQKQVPLLAPAPPAPPLPPLPFAKHVITSSAPANTPPQQPLPPGSSVQFAKPPVPPPPPPQPKQSKGISKAKLSCGKSQDLIVKQQQQQRQPNSGGGNVEVKSQSTISDVQRLVAQQAAAAALTRRRHLDQPEHSAQLAEAAAATPADSKADKLVHTCTPTASHMHLASFSTLLCYE